jgi:hypothetical protein
MGRLFNVWTSALAALAAPLTPQSLACAAASAAARAAAAAAAVSTVVCAALPLLQQLQRSGPPLPAAAAAAGCGVSDIGFMQKCYQLVQIEAAQFLQCLSTLFHQRKQDLSAEVLMQVGRLISDPASFQLLLQLLASHTMLLHQQHTTYLQQQRLQHTPGSSSSSSGQGVSQQAGHSSKQLRVDRLPIPCFHGHQDMLQLLPGGQVYFDTAAAMTASTFVGNTHAAAEALLDKTSIYAAILVFAVNLAEQHEFMDWRCPVLSDAFLCLVLELQLLAAWVVRQQLRQQQQGHSSHQQASDTDAMLLKVNMLLLLLLRVVLPASGSCLPPDLLQQHSLQLLPALAAPVQLLLLSCRGSFAHLSSAAAVGEESRREQMFALIAAAAGMTSVPSRLGESGCGCDCFSFARV